MAKSGEERFFFDYTAYHPILGSQRLKYLPCDSLLKSLPTPMPRNRTKAQGSIQWDISKMSCPQGVLGRRSGKILGLMCKAVTNLVEK
jgi:hypothetical protein